jgi:Asp/Glu/hydantoin racemase
VTGPPSAPAAINNGVQAQQSADACLPIILERMNAPNPPSAVLVACYSEHPLVAMLQKEIKTADFRALGIFEASVAAALETIKPGEKWGIVTTGKDWEPLLTDGALKILSERDDDSEPDSFAGVIGTGLGVLELHDGDAEDVKSSMTQAAKQLVAKGAAAICLGCAGMSGLDEIVQNAVREEGKPDRVKVIDGVRYGVQALRAQVSESKGNETAKDV